MIKRIKAFKKSVGTSLEGIEEQVTGLFLALEDRRKKKLQEEGAQKKMVKVGQKGHQELKNLASTYRVVKLTQLEEDRLVGIGLLWYINESENSFMEC